MKSHGKMVGLREVVERRLAPPMQSVHLTQKVNLENITLNSDFMTVCRGRWEATLVIREQWRKEVFPPFRSDGELEVLPNLQFPSQFFSSLSLLITILSEKEEQFNQFRFG